MKVLVADDDAVSRRVVEALLEREGHTAIRAADGAEGLAILLSDSAPPLAILNWMMPEMTGVEVCRRIRENSESALPYIIFVTGRDRKADIVEGLDLGGNDYVTKPFNVEELLARIRVGARVVGLQQRLMASERDRAVAQTAGAAAHEINQPLTVLIGTAQLLLEIGGVDAKTQGSLESIHEASTQIEEIVKRMRTARRFVSRSYIKGVDILDFNRASEDSDSA